MEVDMVVSMVVSMVVTMASVKLTVMLMHTLLDRLPMASLRLMPMPLVTPTMLESLLESIMAMVEYPDMVLLVTEDTSAPLATVDTHTMAEQFCFEVINVFSAIVNIFFFTLLLQQRF